MGTQRRNETNIGMKLLYLKVTAGIDLDAPEKTIALNQLRL
jgi:hypothetical protein